MGITNESKKKYNTFSEKMIDKYGEYYIGYTNNTNSKFFIDAEDYEKIKDHCWTESVTDISRLYSRIDGKMVTMHIFLGYKNYDHIDRNELNNRRYNLRQCTNQENSRNRNIQKNNTSGIIGVSQIIIKKPWRAYITISGKQHFLGKYETKEEAIIARLKAEKEYFKEFAPQKDLFEHYGI